MRYFLYVCFIAVLCSGCQSKQVRHLASDAALIKPGVSTVADVRRYLGEPNGHRSVSPGELEYVYYEELPGMFGHTPVLGSWTDAEGYEMIVISIRNDVVTSCEFRTFSEGDKDWADDFTWEEVK